MTTDERKRLCLDHGSVTIINVNPSDPPPGWTHEFAAVKAARVSFDLGLKDPISDAALLRYLVLNQHTSPLEMCSVTFEIKAPKFVIIQMLRHRTGKFNEFSQRYAEVKESIPFYDPLAVTDGIRTPDPVNRQSSVIPSPEVAEEIRHKMFKVSAHLAEIRRLYHEMIEVGCAKEVARYCLPMATYSTLHVQFDLSNLLKFLHLRCDVHTQWETRVFAMAMRDLARPLFPTVFQAFEDLHSGVTLSGPELIAFTTKTPLETKSVSERKAYMEKLKLLSFSA